MTEPEPAAPAEQPQGNGFHPFGEGLFGLSGAPPSRGALKTRFVAPPFTVWNAREGAWQDRKRAWISLGIRSELGRGGNTIGYSEELNNSVAGKGYGKTYNSGAPGDLGKTYGNTGNILDAQERKKEWDKAKSEGKTEREGLLWKGKVKNLDYYRDEKKAAELGNGLTFGAGADAIGFYAEKRKKEAELGRELSFEEFAKIRAAKHAIPGGGTGKNSAWLFQTEDGYAAGEEAQGAGSGTSIFDPVVCELCYRWFCAPGGQVVDPFAGGSVRGIVAGCLGRKYWGCDLRSEQVEENRKQAEVIKPSEGPVWHCGDSSEDLAFEAPAADFVFSCPPYGDLEVYSDDPKDLSAMTTEGFIRVYREIIGHACGLLRPDRFACFVVGDFRDKKTGMYRAFVSETINAFEAAGLGFYNEAIIVTAVGSASMRATKQFNASRKLVKTHQNVLVFCKGDPRTAAAWAKE